MPLRQYQIDLINDVKKAYKDGKKAPCIVLPCGGGKSVIVADIAKRTTDKGNRVLFLVHRKELCDQIRDTFTRWGVNMELCSIGMVQTFTRHIDRLEPPTLIITDENHHSLAASYKRIYEAFPNAYRIGVTATPVRLDGSGLADVNDTLIIGVTVKWLIDHQYLSPYDYYAPSVADMSKVRTVRGEYDAKSAADTLMSRTIYGDVISHYRKLANGQKSICYCATVKHSKEMAAAFSAAGIPAAHIDGETPKDERDTTIAQFREGLIQVLCNVDLISEGFDVPDCSCAILLRPTKSLTLYIQQSMRCMRYQEGKRAIIIDHVGNYSLHGLPDQDREWKLEGHPKRSRQKEAAEEVLVKSCPECYRTFPAKDASGQRIRLCPFCGAELPMGNRELEEQRQAVLQKIEGFVLNYDSPNACTSFNELLAYAKRKGYKPGWAYYQAQKRGLS